MVSHLIFSLLKVEAFVAFWLSEKLMRYFTIDLKKFSNVLQQITSLLSQYWSVSLLDWFLGVQILSDLSFFWSDKDYYTQKRQQYQLQNSNWHFYNFHAPTPKRATFTFSKQYFSIFLEYISNLILSKQKMSWLKFYQMCKLKIEVSTLVLWNRETFSK